MELSIIVQDPSGDARRTAFLIFTNVLSERVLRQVATAETELAEGACQAHRAMADPISLEAPAQAALVRLGPIISSRAGSWQHGNEVLATPHH